MRLPSAYILIEALSFLFACIFSFLHSRVTPVSISLPSAGKAVKKEPEHEDAHLHLETAKLLQDLQVDRVGSRPSSNVSSLSNASERDQHHLGEGLLPWNPKMVLT